MALDNTNEIIKTGGGINSPLISVIVPIYNVSQYLNECIDSILGQTYQNLEVILVNDGSTDSSGDICDSYALQDKRIQVIHKINGGLSDARNAGLAIANGEYISFVDSDDYLALDTYEYCVQAYRQHPNVNWLRFSIAPFTEEADRDVSHFARAPEEDTITEGYNTIRFMLFSPFYYGAAWVSLYKREHIEGVLFDVECRHSEDQPFNLMCATRKNKNWQIAPTMLTLKRPLYHYRVLRKGSITASGGETTLCYRFDALIRVLDELRSQSALNLPYACAFLMKELLGEFSMMGWPDYPIPQATRQDKKERILLLSHWCQKAKAYPLPWGMDYWEHRLLRFSPSLWLKVKHFREAIQRRLGR